MNSLSRTRALVLGGLLALGVGVAAPSSVEAKPQPGVTKARSGFRLFARPLGALTVNRIYCGLNASGEICVDSTNSSTIGGGYWPKGTIDQYVFNSGIQVAGVIGADGGPWANDTTGAFFFDPKGTTQHGNAVTPIWNSTNPEDLANWPLAAYVPGGTLTDPATGQPIVNTDINQDNFSEALRGRKTAGQGDVWFLSWEGNPGQNAGRSHPLGVLVEHRGIGYNSPAGNQDILYFIYTFYNITSLNEADYAEIRPTLRPILLEQAAQFHALNNARFGVSLPTGGYTIGSLFANFAADMDVADAGSNFASVNLPFNMGYTYEATFSQPAGWTFDPAIFNQPGLFAGAGFVGVKYLKSPIGEDGQEVGLSLFSNTSNGGNFGDPQNAAQLYRYISGNIDPAQGDEACNVGGQVCYVNNATPDDMRFFQSSGPLTLAPGKSGSIVVAYIFAPPASTPGCSGAPCPTITPGNLQIIRNMGDAAFIAANGFNTVDRVSGVIGATDGNGDGILDQTEFDVVPGSLLGKAAVAQTVFDLRFLQPAAPDAPDFFLVPGDNRVTVLWRPSETENTACAAPPCGDPYFAVASTPTVTDTLGNVSANLIYDPNYRQFDVEGYRIYRGRVDSPNELTLIAQFDYAGTNSQGTSTAFTDNLGIVNPIETCAPELGVVTDCPVIGTTPNSLQLIDATDYDINEAFVQVRLGERRLLSSGVALIVNADTAITGAEARAGQRQGPSPAETGVPFTYVDDGSANLNNVPAPRNNFRYFYSVASFDVNSYLSGPSSQESARNTKSVTPTQSAGNLVAGGAGALQFLGRGVELDTTAAVPTLDPATGTFSGPFPPSNAWGASLSSAVGTLLPGSGSLTIRLDSIDLGSPEDGVAHSYWFSISGNLGTIPPFAISILQGATNAETSVTQDFAATQVSDELAQQFGGSGQFTLPGRLSLTLPGAYYTGIFGRGCVNGAAGFGDGGASCSYNGGRWFAGPSPANNETMAHPNGGNTENFAGVPMTNLNNAGELPGVVTIHNAQCYQSLGGASCRGMEGAMSGAYRAADFNVYWGEGGTVDSVIDVTHNVVVPFSAEKMGGTWGILNPSAALPSAGSRDARDELTVLDFGCVEPIKGYTATSGVMGDFTCATGPTYALSATAAPGPIAMAGTGSAAGTIAAPAAANAGFAMYLPGDFYMFELAGGTVPAAGTVWSLRQYIGAIAGGQGGAGDQGPYEFTSRPRSYTAVGTEFAVAYSASAPRAATVADLDRVHTVPDPYYVTSAYEQSADDKRIKFVNLPTNAIIRIYSSSGVLVSLLENPGASCQNVGLTGGAANPNKPNNPQGGECTWNVRNRNDQVVASGVYFYHIESGGARRVGRFTVINFAQ